MFSQFPRADNVLLWGGGTHGQGWGRKGGMHPPMDKKQVPSPFTEKWVPTTKNHGLFYGISFFWPEKLHHFYRAGLTSFYSMQKKFRIDENSGKTFQKILNILFFSVNRKKHEDTGCTCTKCTRTVFKIFIDLASPGSAPK